MKVVVDLEMCCQMGQCTIVSPALFRLGAAGLEFTADPPESVRADVEAAISSCPMEAIEVHG